MNRIERYRLPERSLCPGDLIGVECGGEHHLIVVLDWGTLEFRHHERGFERAVQAAQACGLDGGLRDICRCAQILLAWRASRRAELPGPLARAHALHHARARMRRNAAMDVVDMQSARRWAAYDTKLAMNERARTAKLRRTA